jgi:hypothetical protein
MITNSYVWCVETNSFEFYISATAPVGALPALSSTPYGHGACRRLAGCIIRPPRPRPLSVPCRPYYPTFTVTAPVGALPAMIFASHGHGACRCLADYITNLHGHGACRRLAGYDIRQSRPRRLSAPCRRYYLTFTATAPVGALPAILLGLYGHGACRRLAGYLTLALKRIEVGLNWSSSESNRPPVEHQIMGRTGRCVSI